jgi:hypothetical protein
MKLCQRLPTPLVISLPVQAGVEPNAVVYEWVEEACRTGGRLDKIVQLKWERCVVCVDVCMCGCVWSLAPSL